MRTKALWWCALLAATASLACGSGGGDDPAPEQPSDPPPASDPVAVAILKLHNDARAAASPMPVPALSPLSWSASAASAAQAWADGCSWGHDPKLNTSLHMGQNIYTVASDSASVAAKPSDVVGAWVAEKSDYDYATGCATGKVCGHYTQVVWRSTTGVGCAHKLCNNGITMGNPPHTYPHWDFWVCNYVPPGNYVGQKPY